MARSQPSPLSPVQVRLKDSLVSSLQFCKAKDAELAWIDGVLDMRVSKVDTGVILEEGELKDDGEDADMQVDLPSDPSVLAQQKAMKSLFGDDEKEAGEESEIIPTLEPLPPHEVRGLAPSPQPLPFLPCPVLAVLPPLPAPPPCSLLFGLFIVGATPCVSVPLLCLCW